MKQVPSDKYNVAWFKLAQYVSRREKERALGVYRLLSHSISDAAYACQLEGDILLAFNDEQAEHKYLKAAQLYAQQQQLLHAIAMYENLLLFKPKNIYYVLPLVTLYIEVQKQERVDAMLELLGTVFHTVSSSATLQECGNLICHVQDIKIKLKLYEQYLFAVIAHNKTAQEVTQCIDITIALLLEQSDSTHLQQLLVRLQAVDQNYYEYAHSALSK